MSLLALAPAHAPGQDNRSDGETAGRVKVQDGTLALEVSLQDFMELQRLDDDDRRLRLGLPASCRPGITAMKPAISSSSRLFVLVSCSPATAD